MMYQNPGMLDEPAFIDPNDPANNQNRGAPGQQRPPARVPTPPANQQQPQPMAPPPMAPPAAPGGPAPMPSMPPTPMPSVEQLTQPPQPVGQFGPPGTMQRPAMLPTSGQTLFPAADNAAMTANQAGQGGYLPPNMAFAAVPGMSPPMPGLEALTDDAGNSYFVGAGSPGTPSAINARTNAQGIQGLPSFDVFRQQNMNSGIGANTPALQRAYASLADQMSRPQIGMTNSANETTRTNAMFGPGGIEQQRTNLARDETLYGTSGQRAIDQMIAQASAAGALPDDLTRLVSGFRTGRGGAPGSNPTAPTDAGGIPTRPITGSPTPTPGPTTPTTPPPVTAPNPQLEAIMRRTLLGIPGSGADATPGQPFNRQPLTLPASVGPTDRGRNAITDFVHSANSAGLINPQSLPEVMRYMTQVMGANAVDPWSRTTRYPWSSGPQFDAMGILDQTANQISPGVANGSSVGDRAASWLMNPSGAARTAPRPVSPGAATSMSPIGYLSGLFGGGGQ